MDKRIIELFAQGKVLSFATVDEEGTYSANCFYAFDRKKNIYFHSSDTTKHLQLAQKNKAISGTIYLPFEDIKEIKGLQFKGQMFAVKQNEVAMSCYLEKFPFVKSKEVTLWGVSCNWVKMTDNSRFFGEKLEWLDDHSTKS